MGELLIKVNYFHVININVFNVFRDEGHDEVKIEANASSTFCELVNNLTILSAIFNYCNTMKITFPRVLYANE